MHMYTYACNKEGNNEGEWNCMQRTRQAPRVCLPHAEINIELYGCKIMSLNV